MSNTSHGLSLVRAVELNLNIEQAFDLISGGKVFELTGANSIRSDFVKAGRFKLGFEDRGSISGQFKTIDRPGLIEISWDVSGFGRPNEHSKVTFSFKRSDETKTMLEVKHGQILSQESLDTKIRAWTEILSELLYGQK